MKRTYLKPVITEANIKPQTQLLSGTVMNPGGDNTPPGAREVNNNWDE